MEKRATIYQRWRESDGVYRWHKVNYHPNKKPVTDPRATQFMVRYTENRERKQMPFDSIDPAMDFCRQKNIQFATEREGGQPTPVAVPQGQKRTPTSQAVERYFNNLEAKGKDAKMIKTYKVAVYGFVDSCRKLFVEDVEEQDLFNYMARLRRQPQKPRKHSDPERTYLNKCSHVAIFLKAFGKSGLLKKNDYPAYDDKPVRAHTDDELDWL